MGRSAKPAKAKVEARLPVRGKAPKNEDARVRDLENRLAESLKREAEALEQQTATAEILRVIASSPTDSQPVFDTILDNATRLCGAARGGLFLFDGEAFRAASMRGATPASFEYHSGRALRPGPHSALGRIIHERQPVHIRDLMDDPAYREGDPLRKAVVDLEGMRTLVMVPLLKGERLVGAIGVHRREVRPFSDAQIGLLQTFADQAVIALENVRLFNETSEALEQQTATSEILRVISSSHTDLQPVFDAILHSAGRLCDATFGALQLFDGEHLTLDGHYGISPEDVAMLQAQVFPMRPDLGSSIGRAIIRRATVHIEDIRSDPEFRVSALQTREGYRTALSVPMLRGDIAVGVINLWRRDVRPFSQTHIDMVQTFADQAVIAIENVRLFTELREKNRDLTEALDQQTATSEVLKVISRSTFDLQPVLETLIENATRLCAARRGAIMQRDGDSYHGVAFYNVAANLVDYIKTHPVTPGRHSITARVALERRTIHVADLQADSEYRYALRDVDPIRTELGVPMLRGDDILGVIILYKLEVQPFTDKQIELVETFADQAVIAIENVRLFKELEARNRDLTESLEQQTATSEILRVIASSPTDLQPVLDAVVRSAARLCETVDAAIFRVDGDGLRLVAHDGAIPPTMPVGTLGPAGRDSVNGRAVREGQAIHVPDLQVAADEFPAGSAHARRLGFRATLVVPLMRENVVIGTIAVRRAEARPFADTQIELLKTFADQAVIAIENVRLFKELQEKNRALTTAHAQVTEALDQQTATSEILRTIAHAQADVQPVFDTIVQSAARLCHASHAAVFLTGGGMVYNPANCGSVPEALAAARARFPRPVGMDTTAGMAILTRSVVHVPDSAAPSALEIVRQVGPALGFRSVVTVPMLREGEAVGAILVARRKAGRFSDVELELLKTFADQAVIAVENVRLFKALEARTQELTRSVEQLTALGEVGRAVSSTLDLQTVLDTIVARATQLADVDAGVIYEYDEHREIFEPRATHHLEDEIVRTLVTSPVRKGEGATGRLAEVREPIQLPDIRATTLQSPVRDALLRAGYRGLLALPLLSEDHLIGGLTVIRKEPGEFAPELIDVLRTFATQSALAIQNARLFREIEEKGRQLEIASQHKSEFLANMSHELRTPLNAIIGFSEVLGERMFGELNEKQAEYLKDIHASGQHLLSLINDILDLSKIEAGRMELELADFHLPQAIENAVVLVRERALRRGITLEQSIDPRLGEIQGDERKVKQVLLNLLSNAIKFTPEGGRIEVRARPVNGFAEIAVSDIGIGIAPEDQEAVFEEFRQVGTAEKKAEGTGLGLALSRKFIELHGGRIWVESELGVGSTFTFRIPVRRGE